MVLICRRYEVFDDPFVKLFYINTDQQRADVFTKALTPAISLLRYASLTWEVEIIKQSVQGLLQAHALSSCRCGKRMLHLGGTHE